LLSDKILKKFRDNNISGWSLSEINSWQNSYNFMKNVLEDANIYNDVKVAIEYQIPNTSNVLI
jgi:hypothetical protein